MDLAQAYSGRQVLVTGAAGFIGSHLVDALVKLGARVRAVDDLSAGQLDNLTQSMPRIDFRQESVVDSPTLDDALAGCDWVFHLAANASVPRSSEEPAYDFQANMVGLFKVLDAFRRTRAGRLVFASSAAVYGEPLEGAMPEEHALRPKSPYAGTKLAGEFLLDAFARCYDLDVRRVRIFNTYGPRQRRYVMYDLLEKLRRDQKKLEVIGTGLQERDYNFVADTVAALLLVGAHPEARGNVYNIAGGRPITIRELVDVILEVTGIERPQITYTGQSWRGDVVRMIGRIERLRSLGYEHGYDLRAGLRELVAWHRAEFSPPW